MPSLSSLAVYVVRVKNVHKRDREILSQIGGADDLLDLLSEYIDELTGVGLDNEDIKVVIRVLHSEKEKRSLVGVLETGAYGDETTIVHRKTKKHVLDRKADMADMWRFLFYFKIPKGTDEGILIVQRRGNYGIRSILHQVLSEKFTKKFADMRLHIEALILKKDFERLMKGRVTRVRYTQYRLSSDLADSAAGGHEESAGTITLTFKARRGRYFDLSSQLQKVMGGAAAKDVFALEDNDFEFDRVNVSLEQKGRNPRQVNLTDLKSIRSYRDITDKLDGRGKSPNDLEALKEIAAEFLREVEKELYGKAGAE